MSKPIINEKTTAAVKLATEDILAQKYNSEMGQKAVIQRTKIDNEKTDALKEVLKDIGTDLVTLGEAPSGMPYIGSIAVHIYAAPNLNMHAFIVQKAINSVSEIVASKAIGELKNSVVEYYGHKRQKLRSGF